LGKYEGQWRNDEMEGQGTITFHNGYFIEGVWKGGKPLLATATWPNGNKYEGEFKNWDWNGQGNFSVPSGHHIIGEFREYEPWETIEYDKNGEIVGKVVDGVQTIDNSLQITPKLEVDATS